MTKRIREIKLLLIDDIRATAEARGLSQTDLCKRFGIPKESRSRVSRLMSGAADEFSLNQLIAYVYKMGRKVSVEVTK